MSNKTREQWLNEAVTELTPLFTDKGYKVPAVRVSCGWPSIRGMSRKQPRIGECWDAAASTDKLHQIFISPRLKDPVAAYGVIPTLAHELVHTVVGLKAGHKGPFRKCATAIGLEGKMTATTGGKEFLVTAAAIVAKLGDYPHAQLNPRMRPEAKQTTRLLKVCCPQCQCTVRMTRKWLDEVGAPVCACGTEMKEESKDE